MKLTDLKKRVSEIEKDLDREQIFESEAFGRLSQAAVDAMTVGLGKVNNENVYAPHSEVTAYSSGGQIVVNTGMSLVEEEDDLKKAFLLIAGLRAHECGHELFTDFPVWSGFFTNLDHHGRLKADVSKEFEDLKKAFEKDLAKNENKRNVFCSITKTLQNVFEDGFVNNGIYAFFAGEPSVGLKALNEKAFGQSTTTLAKIIEEVKSGITPLVSGLIDYMHKEAVGYKYEEGSVDKTDALYKVFAGFLSETQTQRNELLYEPNSEKRKKAVSEILLKLYELINENEDALGSSASESGKGEPTEGTGSPSTKSGKGSRTKEFSESAGSDSQDSQNSEEGEPDQEDSAPESEEGGSESSKGEDMSPEEQKKIQRALEEIKGQTRMKSGGKPLMSGIDKLDPEQIEKVKERKESADPEEKLAKLEHDVALEQALKEAESAHHKELIKQAEKINRRLSEERGASFVTVVNRPKPEYGKQKAEECVSKVKKEAHLLSRKLSSILKDREVEDLERGYWSGHKVFVKDAAKPGLKVFAKRNEPTGKPNLAVHILVDESGSMSCYFDRDMSRDDKARERAICLHLVLKELGIAHAITGFTNEQQARDSLELDEFVDYETIDNKDLYRLGNISWKSENRDGAAISYCCERLLKRPEDKKVLIVLSDGLPSHAGYLSSTPLMDAVLSVEKYTKKDISIFGAVIADDAEDHRKIYGNDKTLDCSTAEKFRKELSKLIQRYVLS